MLTKIDIINKQIKKTLKNNFGKIIEINEKYAEPRIYTSGRVKFALLFLQIYLFLIIGLLVYKFITLL